MKEEDPPQQFTEAQREETKAWLRGGDKRAKEDAKGQATQKAAMLRVIRTRRQQLKREARGKRCTDERRQEIQNQLQDLKGREHQECGTGEPKHPSTRPLARELGFKTDTPSADEILEAATIQRGLRLNKSHLMFAKLAKLDPDSESGQAAEQEAEQEAEQNPRIERAKVRIEYGDIKEVAESKWFKLDRLIAENYFQSQALEKPLRELSAKKASDELLKLGVDISPKAFDRALRRLALVD